MSTSERGTGTLAPTEHVGVVVDVGSRGSTSQHGSLGDGDRKDGGARGGVRHAQEGGGGGGTAGVRVSGDSWGARRRSLERRSLGAGKEGVT